jgi:hypothetical protein
MEDSSKICRLHQQQPMPIRTSEAKQYWNRAVSKGRVKAVFEEDR